LKKPQLLAFPGCAGAFLFSRVVFGGSYGPKRLSRCQLRRYDRPYFVTLKPASHSDFRLLKGANADQQRSAAGLGLRSPGLPEHVVFEDAVGGHEAHAFLPRRASS
jgi:hypothetical protein